MTALDFSKHIDKAKQMSNGWWSGLCPAHPDKNPSLNWRDGDDGGVVIKCHAGCTRETILASLGIDDRPSATPYPQSNSGPRYPYYNAAGDFLVEKIRNTNPNIKGKYLWAKQDSNGKYTYGRPKGPLYLYGLPNLAKLNKGETAYIAEGEKDAETLRRHGLVAVSGPDGAGHGKFPQDAIPYFKGLNVVVFQDNDKPGKEYALEEVAAVAAVAASVKLIDLHEIWPDMPEHADISDYLAHFGDEAFTTVQKLIKNTPLWQPSPEQQTSTGFECFTAASLLSQYIEPPKYIVNSLLSEGLTVLAGPPKYGKSFLVLDLCCSVATGTPFLGFSTNQSKVLYLCLEDSKGRLKKRLQAVAQNNLMAQNLFFATNASTMNNGLFEQLEGFLNENPDCRLIVIDTLQKIRGDNGGKDNSYRNEYNEGGKLKAFADKHHICLLVVHHTNKGDNDADPYNSINGTNAIPGSADTNIVMKRNDRMKETTNMYVTGRDTVERVYCLIFNKDALRWKFEGDAVEIESNFRRSQYVTDDVVKAIKEAVALGNGTWRGTMSELNGVALKTPDVGHTLADPARLARRVKELEDDLYLYDGISHTVIKNGSGGSPHIFTQANKDGLERWQEVKDTTPFDNPPTPDKST